MLHHRDLVGHLGHLPEIVGNQNVGDPQRSCSALSNAVTWPASVGSSPLKLSSRISSFGSTTSARAIASRWRSPPLNSWARFPRAARAIPVSSSAAAARSRRSPTVPRRSDHQRLFDNFSRREPRIKARGRLLENQLDVHPPVWRERTPFEQDLAARRSFELRQAACQRTLARARSADYRQRPAPFDAEADPREGARGGLRRRQPAAPEIGLREFAHAQ